MKKNNILTLLLVTGIMVFASFKSGYATEVWENYTMTSAINQETCCLEITLTNTNSTEELFFSITKPDGQGGVLAEIITIAAGESYTYEICPLLGESEIYWSVTVGYNSQLRASCTNGTQYTDIADVCGECPDEYFSMNCNLTYGSSSIIELTPCCSLRVNYCYCESKINEKFMYITNMAVIQNCGQFGECDFTKNQIMSDPTYYLNKAWKQIAFDEISEWGLTLEPCDETAPSEIIFRLGFAACWSDEWHEVLVFIPGDGALGGTEDTYEGRWVMRSCGVEISEGTTCTLTYSVCWDFINGEWVIVETLEDAYSPNVDCGEDCNYICE